MYDIIALTFFFLVRDQGSWKDIGISIGHYIVASAFIIIQLGLFGVSQLYLWKIDVNQSSALPSSPPNEHKNKQI